MKKRLSVFCSALAVIALLVTVLGVKMPKAEIKNDVSYAALEQYYDDADDMNTTMENEPTEETSSSGGSSGGIFGGGFGEGFLDGIGGIGGIFGDTGDILGGIFGGDDSDKGSGGSSGGTVNTTTGGNDAIYIDPVPAATQSQSQTQNTVVTDIAQTTIPVAETVNFAAISNPYAKPVTEIKPGDMGDGVKWIQWNLIYTGYGLQGKPVTGVYDDATAEVVKKLQAEKGLTADGVVNDEVVAHIDLLYYEYITANPQTTVPQMSAVDTTFVQPAGTTDNNEGPNILVIVIAVILIGLIWFVAIIAIIIILIVKKSKSKKKTAAKAQVNTVKTEEKPQENTEKPETVNQDKEMSLSDLFEEANNKKK